MRAELLRSLAGACARVPSRTFRRALMGELFRRDPQALHEALSPFFILPPTLATTPFDLDPARTLEFEDLAGLFASNVLNHGVMSMTIRQAAYVFGHVRRSGAGTAIEIGRWRGGSTILLAAAMGPGGKVWSVDLLEKEERMLSRESGRFDEETRELCQRFGLDVELAVGDSRTLELDTGEVDVVLIDGDHSYAGAKTDFERWGRRVRVGGAVFMDDAFADEWFPSAPHTVRRVVEEAVGGGEFVLRKAVDRLAHLERVR